MTKDFTAIEHEILNTVLAGHTTGDELAKHLYLGRQTVYYHLKNMFDKIGVRSKTELVLWAWRNGWELPKIYSARVVETVTRPEFSIDWSEYEGES